MVTFPSGLDGRLLCPLLHHLTRATLLAGFCIAAHNGALAAATECVEIDSDADRLACYDRAAGRQQIPTPAASPSAVAAAEPVETSPLARRWELTQATKQGTFAIRPYRPTYLLPGYFSDSINERPEAGSVNATRRTLDDTEAKFQLSFKTKLAENLLFNRADLWFAYTQQSYWQVYNKQHSAPFRETNYEPELLLTLPTDYNLFGLRGRLVNLGMVHQSNGQGDPRSRSWNRVYAQFGFERGNFFLMLRPWWRFSEDADDDDNPGIMGYLGRGEILAGYRRWENVWSVQLRNNFKHSDNHGSAQFDWSFPLASSLRGYLQFFAGYGQNLIDYNHHQNAVGIGVLLVDWL